MKILAISDVTLNTLYNHQIKARFPDIGLIISCGDLPRDYQEYVVSMLDARFFYVLGNHDSDYAHDVFNRSQSIAGGTDLHRESVYYDGVILAGVEGSLKYRDGPHQYAQSEMWNHVIKLIPQLLINRIRYGRYLDIFVTHAPAAGIHDKQDLPHRGIFAFRWLIEKFKPRYHLHGHVHVYHPNEPVDTMYANTRVINAYGYKVIETSF